MLLNNVFDHPSPELRLKFKEWLSDTENYYKFFFYIRYELLKSKNRIMMRYRTDKSKVMNIDPQ